MEKKLEELIATGIAAFTGGGVTLVLHLSLVAQYLPENWFLKFGAASTLNSLVAGIGTSFAALIYLRILKARDRKRLQRLSWLEDAEREADELWERIQILHGQVNALALQAGFSELDALSIMLQRTKPVELPDQSNEKNINARQKEAQRAVQLCKDELKVLLAQRELVLKKLRALMPNIDSLDPGSPNLNRSTVVVG